MRWSAPEVFRGTFTIKSDVWSFGVTMWELFSFATVPYVELSAAEVVEKVLSGHRLQRPYKCPKQVFAIMTTCWEEEPAKRPSFKVLYNKIHKLWVEKSNVQHSPKVIPHQPAQTTYEIAPLPPSYKSTPIA